MLKRIPILWKLCAASIIIVMLALIVLDYVHYVIIAAVAIVLICLSAHFLMNRFVKRPIRGLVNGMNQLAEKNFDFRLDEDEKDEFGSLASSFNDMASMLSSSLTELKKNQDYLRSVIESSADIIITVTPSGRIQTINTGAENALGYERVEVIGKPVEILFADPHERDVAIEKLKLADSLVNYEVQLLTKSNSVRDVLLTISRLRNSEKAVIGTIGIGKDITEEKRLQSKLIQAQRLAAIGEVFTGIQHSMKNMLNACTGGAYMVRTGLAGDNREMLEDGWEMVQDGITRMTDMSSNMLKYVKEWVPKSVRVDLTQTISEIYSVIGQTAKDKGVEIRLHIAPDLPPVVCDKSMIHSTVMDIVSNAVDACLWKDYGDEETPEIAMRAYPNHDGKEVVIEIKDNGCGMSEDVKANIFTPFFSTKSKAGTGLGLSLSSRMINVHGGRIDVESEPDHGATFRIVLPVDGNDKNKEYTDGKESSGS